MKLPWGRRTAEQERALAEAAGRVAEARAAAARVETLSDAVAMEVAAVNRDAKQVAERARRARERNHIGEMVDAALGYGKERPA